MYHILTGQEVLGSKRVSMAEQNHWVILHFHVFNFLQSLSQNSLFSPTLCAMTLPTNIMIPISPLPTYSHAWVSPITPICTSGRFNAHNHPTHPHYGLCFVYWGSVITSISTRPHTICWFGSHLRTGYHHYHMRWCAQDTVSDGHLFIFLPPPHEPTSTIPTAPARNINENYSPPGPPLPLCEPLSTGVQYHWHALCSGVSPLLISFTSGTVIIARAFRQ